MSAPAAQILTITCPDTVGIVAAVSGALAAQRAFITESAHFGDPDTGTFFMRTVFRPRAEDPESLAHIRAVIAAVAHQFSMQFAITPAEQRLRVVVAVSKFGHCLNHLLHQWHAGELGVDIVAVVSNHLDLQRQVEWFGIPFHHLPMSTDGKSAQEARFLQLVAETGAELVVLARYMQVLSDDLCTALAGRCINIHHSFLPSFKGAKPYHQAHARGVKVIGATAHYVTADLDEGPIIEQDTVRVDHSMSAEHFVRMGKDVENVVLARAVRWHAERRVLLNGAKKTVVFR